MSNSLKLKQQILAGEYWGKRGALVRSLLTLTGDLRKQGVRSALVQRVSNFYSAAARAKIEKDTGTEGPWLRRYFTAAGITAFFWIFVYTFTLCSRDNMTNGQLDVMGTVAIRLGLKSSAKKFLLLCVSRPDIAGEEHALPLCGLMELEVHGSIQAEKWSEKVVQVLFHDTFSDNNQKVRVLRRLADYHEKFEGDEVRQELSLMYREQADRILFSVGKDQRRKLAL